MNNRGKLIVFSGPSGSGKGTVLKHLMEMNDNLRVSISATTREPRPGEKDKEDYFFISKDQFEEHIRGGGMLEWAEYVGNYYGTPRVVVENWLKEGRDVILEIEVDGAMQIKQAVPEAILIFILPPSITELVQRLIGRGTESEERIQKRLEKAKREFTQIAEYEYVVINDIAEEAAARVNTIIQAETWKYRNMLPIIEEVMKDA